MMNLTALSDSKQILGGIFRKKTQNGKLQIIDEMWSLFAISKMQCDGLIININWYFVNRSLEGATLMIYEYENNKADLKLKYPMTKPLPKKRFEVFKSNFDD